MRVAVTGVSGFLGSYIVKHLCESGHEITGLVRETSRRDHIENAVDRFVVGDHADESVWDDLFDGADGVIHCSVNWQPMRGGTDNLDEYFKSNLNPSIKMINAAGKRQFIFISTIAVHHDMSPRWNGLIDEEHPLRPGSLYGAYKAAIEAHLWHAHLATGQNTCAIRPCAVYGIDPNLKRSYGIGILRRANSGKKPLHKPGGGKFVHVEDVAQAVANAVGNENVAGKPFNMVDCYARWADWAKLACKIVGHDDSAVDYSSPAEPANQFKKDSVQNILGVEMNRGLGGIETYMQELAGVMEH